MEKKYPLFRDYKNGSRVYFKSFTLSDLDIKQSSEGLFVAQGYANTKNKEDSYGDIPTNFKNKPVYDLSRMKSNPVMLMDHDISAASIIGNFSELKEDENGLYFKSIFRPLDQVHNPLVKDAISSYVNGFARALSIGGRWFFEDKDNPKHLTRAVVHEISGVAVGADSLALISDTSELKAITEGEKGGELAPLDELASLIKSYSRTGEEETLSKIYELKKIIRGN